MHVSRKSQLLLFEASDRSALLPVISWWCKGKNGQLILLETNSKICFGRRTNECVMAHPAQAASTQLPPRRCLLLAAHITCGVIYCFILWLRVLAKWGSRCQCAQQVSTFNCLGVLAQTSVCPTSCAAPQETQYGVYLVCCKSHSWPVSSLMHGVPRSLCSRAPAGTGTQGTAAPGHHSHLSFAGLPELSSSPLLLFVVAPHPVSATPSSSALPSPQSTSPAHLLCRTANPFAITLIPNSRVEQGPKGMVRGGVLLAESLPCPPAPAPVAAHLLQVLGCCWAVWQACLVPRPGEWRLRLPVAFAPISGLRCGLF